MKTRLFTHEDYPMLVSWWEGHGWPAVPEIALPKVGILIESLDSVLAAAWLYFETSGVVCQMEWVVTNPNNKPKDSVKALSLLLDAIDQVRAANGYKVTQTACKVPSLIRLYEKAGFVKTDEGITHMVKGGN